MATYIRSTTVSHLAAACLLACVFAVDGRAQERMPPIPTDKMTDAQKQASAEFQAARGSTPGGPFGVLLRSPDLMNRFVVVSEYIRIKGILPQRIKQLIVLLAARHWTAQFEWAVQYPQSISAGMTDETIQAIRDGRRPDHMTEDETIMYDVCLELLRNQGISDVTYNRAVARFGEQGVVEAVSTAGYFSLLGMLLNTARTPPPEGTNVPALAPLSP